MKKSGCSPALLHIGQTDILFFVYLNTETKQYIDLQMDIQSGACPVLADLLRIPLDSRGIVVYFCFTILYHNQGRGFHDRILLG